MQKIQLTFAGIHERLMPEALKQVHIKLKELNYDCDKTFNEGGKTIKSLQLNFFLVNEVTYTGGYEFKDKQTKYILFHAIEDWDKWIKEAQKTKFTTIKLNDSYSAEVSVEGLRSAAKLSVLKQSKNFIRQL